jgi:hypothetical protein
MIARTVLVVDDEPDVRKVVRKILLRHGYEVLEAEDGVATSLSPAASTGRGSFRGRVAVATDFFQRILAIERVRQIRCDVGGRSSRDVPGIRRKGAMQNSDSSRNCSVNDTPDLGELHADNRFDLHHERKQVRANQIRARPHAPLRTLHVPWAGATAIGALQRCS